MGTRETIITTTTSIDNTAVDEITLRRGCVSFGIRIDYVYYKAIILLYGYII